MQYFGYSVNIIFVIVALLLFQRIFLFHVQFVNGMNTSYVQIRNELASEQLIKVQFQVAMSGRYSIKFSYIHVLKFRCHDLNHSFPGQARFYCFPFINHFLTRIVMPWSFFKEFSSACNWKQNFQFSFLETQNTFFVIATSFCIGWNHGSEFHEF